MSRSKKKTPIVGVTSAYSEKWDKKLMHKKIRAATRNILSKKYSEYDEIDSIPFMIEDEARNKWDMAKDGKYIVSKNSEWYRKAMRK